MSLSRNAKRVRSAAWGVEVLENRWLLSATVVSQIPTQTLTAGQSAGAGITLSTYLKDPSITGGTVIEMQTPLGNMYLQLTDSQTPHTVANFVQYITNGEYTPTIIQRSAPGFVLQGGGTKPNGSNNEPVSTLVSEAGISNTTGTIAMALSTGPNSGTNQWFINLADNASYLDGSNDGGPFTVFGNVIDGGMTIANNIANLPIIDGAAENSNWYIGPNDGLPVINYSGSDEPTTVPEANLVTDNIVVIPAAQAAPTYSVVSANTSLVTASISNGVLTLHPASNTVSGHTTVTATVTDLGGETASSTFTVDVNPAPTVSVTSATAAAGTGSQIIFPVTLSAASASATTFNYALTAGTAPSSDFQATGNSVTIPAGSTTANIAVNIPTDSSIGNETFTLTLSSLSSNALFSNGSSTLTATGTITPYVPLITTTTTLAASSSSVDQGDSDIFTATVNSSGTTPTGTVTFSSGGTTLGTASLSGDTAVLTTALTTDGIQAITASYGGDDTHKTSTSSAVDVEVVGTTTTALSLSAASVAFGGAETLTANILPAIAGSDATGTVTFSIAGSPIGTAAVTNNIASLVIDLNTAGTQSITAAYSGDADNQASTSTAVSVAVADPSVLAPTVAKSAIPATGIAGQAFKASLTVSLDNPNEVMAQTGAVKVYLYATTDGVISPDSVVIGSTIKSGTIKPGKSTTLVLTIKSLPTDLSAGTYTLVAQAVDSSGTLSTPVTGPTVTIATPTISLTPTFAKLSLPTSVVAGAKTTAIAEIKITNSGNIASSGNTTINLYASPDGTVASGTLIKTLAKKLTIKPDQSTTVSVPLGVYPSVADGDYYVVAQVIDPLSQSTSVASTSTVNIAPANIDLDASALVVPATAVLGKPISAALSLSNLGNVVASGPLSVLVEISNSPDGSNPVQLATLTTTIKLEPGKTQILRAKHAIPAGSITGDVYVIAVVDPANVFGDTDLANNTIVSSAISVG